MRRATIVWLLLACSCKKESSPLDQPPAGAGGSSSDPWSGSAAPASTPAKTLCADDDITKHIDESLSVSLAYLSALETKSAKWSKDCERARKDLIALEPDAQKFMDAMLAFKAWGGSLSDECRVRVAELGDKLPIAAEIEKRTPALEAKVKPILEKCENHPGFKEAAAKGLRVLRKKRSP